MYNTERHTRKFDIDDQEDMTEYDDIMNDPLCTILIREKIKETETTYEGESQTKTDSWFYLVTWEERRLA